MTFKNAFNCKKCPECNDEKGCPMWWETVWEKPDGEVKIIKACGYTQLPLYLIELIKASNRPAAAVESIRNELDVKLEKLCTLQSHGLHQVASAFNQLISPVNADDVKEIECQPNSQQ